MHINFFIFWRFCLSVSYELHCSSCFASAPTAVDWLVDKWGFRASIFHVESGNCCLYHVQDLRVHLHLTLKKLNACFRHMHISLHAITLRPQHLVVSEGFKVMQRRFDNFIRSGGHIKSIRTALFLNYSQVHTSPRASLNLSAGRKADSISTPASVHILITKASMTPNKTAGTSATYILALQDGHINATASAILPKSL